MEIGLATRQHMKQIPTIVTYQSNQSYSILVNRIMYGPHLPAFKCIFVAVYVINVRPLRTPTKLTSIMAQIVAQMMEFLSPEILRAISCLNTTNYTLEDLTSMNTNSE